METVTVAVDNKHKFLELVNSITREGMNKELLIKQLTNSDFFTAPASRNYHQNYEGGLCEHSLAVYENLVKLNNAFNMNFDEDTMKIVALFHDFSKMNFYTTTVRNKKVYSDNGSKRDGMGNYDWVSVPGYETREAKDRFVFGNHEMTAAFMISTFIPLTVEEYSTICHHHGSMGWDSAKDNIGEIWQKYPISLMLYQADCISAFLQT